MIEDADKPTDAYLSEEAVEVIERAAKANPADAALMEAYRRSAGRLDLLTRQLYDQERWYRIWFIMFALAALILIVLLVFSK